MTQSQQEKDIELTTCIISVGFILQLIVTFVHTFAHIAIPIEGLPDTSTLPFCSFTNYIFNEWLFMEGAGISYFAISAYLFFKGFDSPGAYKSKLMRRIFTLGMPFLIWNLLPVLLTAVADLNINSFRELSLEEMLLGSWPYYFPANGPLWFLRELMLMIIISPVIWRIVRNKYAGITWMIIVFAVWVHCSHFAFGGRSNVAEAMLGFSIGAYMKRHDYNILHFNRKIVFSALALTAITLLLSYHFPEYNVLLSRIRFLFKLIIFISLGTLLGRSAAGKWMVGLCGAAFFIFLSHSLFLKDVITVTLQLFMPVSDIGRLLCFFAAWIATITLCMAIWWCLLIVAPRLLDFITGGRVKSRSVHQARTAG